MGANAPHKERTMSKKTISPANAATAAFVRRVLQHDSTKKGLAAAFVGVLLAAVAEALRPS
jgi:hypothetical protein